MGFVMREPKEDSATPRHSISTPCPINKLRPTFPVFTIATTSRFSEKSPHGLPLLDRMDRLGPADGEVLDVPARLAAPSRGDDKRNVRAHYDVSNEFFELMLDDTMTYSCGLFERPDASLRDAQVAKIDRLCSKLDLRPGDHLVEIGSGWGGFAVHAAARYGSRVTTTTVSEAQRSYVEKRVVEAGLADRVTVLGDDWRDLRGHLDRQSG